MTGGTEWTYWRPTEEGIVELGTLHGSRVGLPIHFHDENQLTFVLSGRRRFVIRGELIDLLPGQGTFIRAGIPHFSLPEPSGVVCFNAYLPVGGYAAQTMIGEIRRLWHKAGLIRWPELAEVIRGHRAEMPTALMDRAASLPTDSVAQGRRSHCLRGRRDRIRGSKPSRTTFPAGIRNHTWPVSRGLTTGHKRSRQATSSLL